MPVSHRTSPKSVAHRNKQIAIHSNVDIPLHPVIPSDLPPWYSLSLQDLTAMTEPTKGGDSWAVWRYKKMTKSNGCNTQSCNCRRISVFVCREEDNGMA